MARQTVNRCPAGSRRPSTAASRAFAEEICMDDEYKLTQPGVELVTADDAGADNFEESWIPAGP
jgi:hypothetical protein